MLRKPRRSAVIVFHQCSCFFALRGMDRSARIRTSLDTASGGENILQHQPSPPFYFIIKTLILTQSQGYS